MPIAESISPISASVCGANFTASSVRADRSSAGAVLEPVLRDEREVVALIEDLAPDLRIALAQLTDLPVLPGDELLVQRGDLDVEVELREEEVRGEATHHVALTVPFDVERCRLVVPDDAVEVEQLGELALGSVGETDRFALGEGLQRGCDRGHGSRAHDPPAAARLR